MGTIVGGIIGQICSPKTKDKSGISTQNTKGKNPPTKYQNRLKNNKNASKGLENKSNGYLTA